MNKVLLPGLVGLIILIFAACGSSDPTRAPEAAPPTAAPTAAAASAAPPTAAPTAAAASAAPPTAAPTAAAASAAPPTAAPTAAAASAAPATTGEKFEFQLVCISRTVKPCGLMAEFAERVGERTNGQIEIQMTSYPELGIGGADALRLVGSGTLGFAEMYSGYIGSDFPMVEMGELLGLFPDSATQKQVLKAIREDEIRLIKENFGGVVLFYVYYEDQFFWTKDPIEKLEDFQGLKTRTHSTALADLARGLGADGQVVPFAEVYTALERGILDAGVTNLTAGHSQKWHELTNYVIGPMPAAVHTLITMNQKRWDELPPDFQAILREEGERTDAENLASLDVWVEEGYDLMEQEGIVVSDFTPRMKEAIQQAAVDIILPNWVSRAGGYDTEAVRIFNEKVAPIVGIRVTPEGTAELID